ncbi:MAG: DUF4136 domain-containing protein [Vicinamibacterales bacterium]
MDRVFRRLPLLALTLAAFTLGGCAVHRVDGFLERGVNLNNYPSFAWAESEEFSTGDPRLDNNDIFQEKLQSAVARELTARGFERVDHDRAALLVHFHANVHQQIDVNALDTRYGYCDNCHSSVYDAGSITIDLVDARTKKLVWRGWSEGSLDAIDNQATIEAMVDEAVRKIMHLLPPRA